jgi:succinate dehydrogenase/fumarate reductase flavoprotein subunit
LKILVDLRRGIRYGVPPTGDYLETANLLAVAELIMMSALKRQESRGAHYRKDYPNKDDVRFKKHSWVRGGQVEI